MHQDKNHLKTINYVFSEQCKDTPHKICLKSDDESLTYSQLFYSSLNVSRVINEQISSRNTCIAIAGPVSIKSIVALVAIVMAGHHYYWLDTRQPAEFLKQQLNELNCPLILATEECVNTIEALGFPVLHITVDPTPNEPALVAVSPSTPVYVNFSSGTTGQPKAIVCAHAGVIRLCRRQDFLPFESALNFLFHSPLSFDAATLEIWGALLNGGYCVVNGEEPLTPDRVRQQINRNGVDALWLTSALFNALVDTDVTCFTGLGWLITGGDRLSVKHVRKAMEAHPGIQFINGYGPTENTTFTCCHPVSPEDCALEDIPIGQPINGTEILLCDARGNPTKQGEVGEIYTSGEGLALGYLNQPEETARCFVSIMRQGQQVRAYRTGDMAWMDDQSRLRFVGRVDSEVKINGYRLNLAGLESRLREAAGVSDCALLVVGHNESKRVVAVLQADNEESARTVSREFASWERPTAWVCVKQLPRTQHGKRDYRALKNLWWAKQVHNENLTLTALEKMCSPIWSRLLGCQVLSGDQDFFLSGGTSLQAMQLLAFCQSLQPKPPITLKDLYQSPSLRQFALLLERRGVEADMLHHALPDYTLVIS